MFPAVHSLVAASGLLFGGAMPSKLPAAGTPPPLPAEAPVGYLWFYRADDNWPARKEVVPYQPREGDLIFFDDQSKFWTFLYAIARTAPPFHVGIVVKRPDGQLAVLEAGPDDTLHVYVLDLVPRLQTFLGVLQVRRCKVVLSPEQSARLTAFAVTQEGKHYAVWRLLLQGTPCKTRGGLWRHKLAKTRFERNRWLCAEIAVTAAELVGLMDPNVIKGTNTYPLDIIDDHMYALLPVYEEYAYWAPLP
jgi:hypothetical protein